MLSVVASPIMRAIMVSVIMLSVVMLSVVAPQNELDCQSRGLYHKTYYGRNLRFPE